MFSSRWSGPSSAVRVARLAAALGVVGFCGSRRGLSAAGQVALFGALAAAASCSRVLVGDGRGVDALVRGACSRCEVFAVEPPLSRGAFAARSVRFVRELAESGGFLVAFPGGPCPPALVPSPLSRECFCGLGSGSWASVALALGLACPVLVWVPCASWVPSWLEPLGGGWFGAGLGAESPALAASVVR
jgi:hypothetical protein